jgi:hypothetical protein
MQLIKIPKAARRLGISIETARRLARTTWTTYRVGPGSVLVDLDEILEQAKPKPEPEPRRAKEKIAV